MDIIKTQARNALVFAVWYLLQPEVAIYFVIGWYGALAVFVAVCLTREAVDRVRAKGVQAS